MNKYLIIPVFDRIEESLELARKYNLGFEFDDFFSPKILLDENKLIEKTNKYLSLDLPDCLTVHGDFFDVNVFSDDPEIAAVSVKRIYQSMEVANTLKVNKIVFHSNINSYIQSDVYKDNWLNRNYEVFTKVCEQYPSITVLIENMFDDGPEMLLKLASKMEGVKNFAVCLDYSHAFLSKYEPSYWVKTLGKYIDHVHINDNMKDHDSHMALGEGMIDWTEFDELRKLYFPNATVLIEVSSLEAQIKTLEYMQRNNMFD